MPDFLDQAGNTLQDGLNTIKDAISPDEITFGNQPYFRYPADLFDPTKHAQMFVIAPYTGEITFKGKEDTKYIKGDLPPIFLKLPISSETSYEHAYSEESLLYNPRELSQGGGRSGGLSPGDFGEALEGGALRGGLSVLQNLPGGDSARAAMHGGARAAIELLYDSPKLRDFIFTWKFVPDDDIDEQSFIDIYRYLMFLSAPIYSLAAQRYPATFDLQFSTVALNGKGGGSLSSTSLNTVMQFTKCALIGITPNFSPGGGALSPSGLPQEIDLALHFRELMPLDRETIRDHEIGDIQSHEKLDNIIDTAVGDTTFTADSGIRSILGGI